MAAQRVERTAWDRGSDLQSSDIIRHTSSYIWSFLEDPIKNKIKCEHANIFIVTDFKAGVKAIDSEQDFTSKDNIGILGTPSIFVYFILTETSKPQRKFRKVKSIGPQVKSSYSSSLALMKEFWETLFPSPPRSPFKKEKNYMHFAQFSNLSTTPSTVSPIIS